MRPLRANGLERGRAVAVLADHAKIAFRCAELAQAPPSGLLIIDDDDIHHASTNVAAALGALLRAGES